MVKFAGHASAEMPGDAQTSWLEASTLGWLKGELILTGLPRVGAVFTRVKDGHRITCHFTRAEPARALCWEGDDGSSGRLEFETRGETTWASYHAVYVRTAAADKVATVLISVFARGKAQREADKDAASELGRLGRLVKLRTGRKLVDDRAPRFMLDLCVFGAVTPDSASIPVFDAKGQLVMAPGESLLWTGRATPAAEEAQTAGGREQFTTLWKSTKKAAITLTDQRLVYDIRKFTESDMFRILMAGGTGSRGVGRGLTARRAARDSARRSNRTAAGQIRHENLWNLITGAGARTTFAGSATVTATLMEPPKRVIRVHLMVDSRAEDLARRWVQAAATERLQRLARLQQLAGALSKQPQPDERDQLLAQQQDPKPRDSYSGPFWGLPLPCPLGQDRPMAEF
jgi:hypothetical protein